MSPNTNQYYCFLCDRTTIEEACPLSADSLNELSFDQFHFAIDIILFSRVSPLQSHHLLSGFTAQSTDSPKFRVFLKGLRNQLCQDSFDCGMYSTKASFDITCGQEKENHENWNRMNKVFFMLELKYYSVLVSNWL
ncbi:hypothetical protein L6452_31692 [Arctium lappa]|uniref:Uncharacterized protein n=1 Tax=Arctium lappa TaxID=4217 RepID=A0ACB8Z3N3_ARCLA|nr:hypothetical protein L6452_31692 [Arctium lappa]